MDSTGISCATSLLSASMHNAAVLIWQAWRTWQGARAVALLAAAALAVGIGSATAIYSVVNAVMLKPLPYADGDRFVALFGAATNDPVHVSSLQWRDARAFQERTRVFDAFGWFREAGKNLTFAGEPHHVQGVRLTASLAHQLGVAPVLGRWFEDERGVMISHALWRRLGADPAIVGKPLTLDGEPFTVSGVMPASFRLPAASAVSAGFRADVWMPLDPQGRGEPGDGYFAYARRKPGVAFEAAEEDVKRVAAEIASEDPAGHAKFTARLFDLRETVIRDIRSTLLLLFAAAALLFLITCANAAGLLLARAVVRARETAVRVALGARRGQLAAQYFLEGLVVALAGAAGGVALSITLTPALVSMAAEYLPRAEEIAVDWTVLLFALGAAVLASALSSLAPLWQAARTMPAEVLSDGARASAGARSRRISRLLVIGEIALAFAMLAVSAVLIVQLRTLSRTAPGFEPGGILTFSLSIPGTIARDDDTRVAHQQRLVEALQAIPGVDEVAFASQLPLDGCCMGTAIYPEGRPVDLRTSQRTSLTAVSPAYFRAMRVPLRRGRLLTDRDLSDDLIDVVISESTVRRYWDGADPVGTYGRFNTPAGDRFQVIGVVGDVKNDGLGAPSVPEIYIHSGVLHVEGMHFVVRSARPVPSLMSDIRRAVRGIDPEQPIHEIATMSEIVGASVTLQRVASVMTAFFAGAALLLATLGVYGVVAYSVRQRTVEIGTRMALGATNRGVMSLVVGDGLTMTAYGVVAGAVAAIGTAVYLARVFEIGELGAAPFLYSSALVVAVALTASFIPAWRASLLSPMVAIRDQPESMWRSARVTVRRAVRQLTAGAERPIVPLGTLITEFAGAVRQAASFSEAVRVALATLQARAGTESAVLLEKASGGEYRDGDCSIPAHGLLINRLRHYPYPLAFTSVDFETWARWARQLRPEHTAEIDTLARTGVRMALPLRTKTEIVGVLLLGAPEGRHGFTAPETQMLSGSADVFALMVENARLTERALEQEKVRRDLALAAEVQRRLLPHEPPRCGSATLAAFTLPARTVGGDYYDFLDLPDGGIAIAVADIAGKGIAAALLMSVVQWSLRVISADGAISASQLAVKMNRLLYRSTGSSKYATFFYAQLDAGGRRLRYVNAGHNPPYLVRRAGVEVVELRAGGTVLGMFPEVDYDDAEIGLCSGDLFVAFTDGVPEALNEAGEEFGEERLKDLLREAVGASAEDVSSTLAARMREWIGGAEQHDDLTFVVVAMNETLAPRAAVVV